MPRTECELCRRVIPDQHMTEHHLTPEERAESDTIDACVPCHKQLHALYTNHELEHRYNTASELREADEMAAFIDWIRTTKKVDIQVDESTSVQGWRS